MLQNFASAKLLSKEGNRVLGVQEKYVFARNFHTNASPQPGYIGHAIL
jgi:hypothetical protein